MVLVTPVDHGSIVGGKQERQLEDPTEKEVISGVSSRRLEKKGPYSRFSLGAFAKRYVY
jgi:hypothetical protein